jgi:hypothetical protein
LKRNRRWEWDATLTLQLGKSRPGSSPQRESRLLQELSQAAFELIKAVELERSGIRDGNGRWIGSDGMGGQIEEVARIGASYLATWQAERERAEATEAVKARGPLSGLPDGGSKILKVGRLSPRVEE